MRLDKNAFDIERTKDGLYKFKINNVKQFEDCYFYANDEDFLTLGSSINFFFKDMQFIVLFKGRDIQYKKFQWMYLEQMILKGESVKH